MCRLEHKCISHLSHQQSADHCLCPLMLETGSSGFPLVWYICTARVKQQTWLTSQLMAAFMITMPHFSWLAVRVTYTNACLHLQSPAVNSGGTADNLPTEQMHPVLCSCARTGTVASHCFARWAKRDWDSVFASMWMRTYAHRVVCCHNVVVWIVLLWHLRLWRERRWEAKNKERQENKKKQ